MAANPILRLRLFGCEWFLRVEALIHAGKVRAHPIKLLQGGLSGVLAGVATMERRQVSVEKLEAPIAPRLAFSALLAPLTIQCWNRGMSIQGAGSSSSGLITLRPVTISGLDIDKGCPAMIDSAMH